MTTLYTDIGELVTNDPTQGDAGPLGIIADAALVVDGDQGGRRHRAESRGRTTGR